MNIKHTAFLIMLMFSIAAHAGQKDNDDWIVEIPAGAAQQNTQISADPKKAEAEQWLGEFRAAHDKTINALFLNDPDKRAAHTQVLMKLRDRSEKLFGDVFSKNGHCTKAAEWVNGAWGLEVSLMLDPSHNTYNNVSNLARLAWEGGQSYAACRQMIDAIK